MKIPQSVRTLYVDLLPKYDRLKIEVDKIILGQKEKRWHYESRVKGEESFALKLETSRVRNLTAPEDLFACTVVVENHSKIAMAEEFIKSRFKLDTRRPRDPDFTHLTPSSFEFDDLRLYVRWVDDPAQKPTGLAGLQFEVQVKTFLQHAWGIATHDFIYKSDDVNWSLGRIAFQVKAMLENAELSIGEAQRLTESTMLKRVDQQSLDLRTMIQHIKDRWPKDQLPEDLRRLAQTLDEVMYKLDISFDELWRITDEATEAGEGAATLNLSPYAAIIGALIRKRGDKLFEPLVRINKNLFIPLEVPLPDLSNAVKARLIQTQKAG